MITHQRIRLRDSIGFDLLRLVFSIYIFIAILVTIAHMAIEYRNVKMGVKQDLQLYQSTFEGALADALWDLDELALQTISPGILKLPSIVELTIYDLDGRELISAHSSSGDTSNKGISTSGIENSDKKRDASFSHHFDIMYKKEGEDVKVGSAVFASNFSIVIAKVKSGFVLILVNALIKTIALWVIFLWVVRPKLIWPIQTLTRALQRVSLDNLGDVHVQINTKKYNELKVLEESVNTMAVSLSNSSTGLAESNIRLERTTERLQLILDGARKMAAKIERRELVEIVVALIEKALPELRFNCVSLTFPRQWNERCVYDRYAIISDSEHGDEHLSDTASRPRSLLNGARRELLSDTFADGLQGLAFDEFQQSVRRAISYTNLETLQIKEKKIWFNIYHGLDLIGLFEFNCTDTVDISDEDEQFLHTIVQSVILSLEDISVRTELEAAVLSRTQELQSSKQELEKKALDLEEASRYKSRFLTNMSHEVRTPMNAIIGFSVQGVKTSTTDKARFQFRRIHESGQALLSIIDDILDISRIESGSLTIDETPFDLVAILENIYALMYEDAKEKQLALSMTLSADVVHTLLGDATRLTQVLTHLIANAIKFTHKGNIHIAVDCSMDAEDGVDLKFAVTDTGIGIDQSELSCIFDYFSQADSSMTRSYGGAGLGLSISRQIVGLMNGELSVESTLGKGSCFKFNARFKSRERCSPIDKVLRDYDVTSLLQQGDVWVVGDPNVDTDNVLELLRVMYPKAQCLSTTIFSEKLASWQLEKDQVMPALIVFDGENTDILTALKSNNCCHHLPMLAITSPSQHEYTEQECTCLSATQIINRPVFLHMLADAVHAVVSGRLIESHAHTDDIDKQVREELHSRSSEAELVASVQKLDVESGDWWLDGRYSGKRVLVVEDNKINQEIIEDILEEAGIVVTIANHGAECLQYLEKSEFDLVLMDIQMPVMDGLTAAREIRKQEKLQHLPVLALSAHALAEDVQKSKEAGMNCHITKPIDIDVLYANIQQWM